MERTFVIIKPDGVQRGLIGEIVGRFEKRGLKIAAMRFLQVSDELARACGLDAGFGRGTTGREVASFLVRKLRLGMPV